MSEKSRIISPSVDQFSRTISYLRLSVTDKCNLRCMYCMPNNASRVKLQPYSSIKEKDQLLRYEELLRLVGLAVSLGMTKIRLTGGEPLVRNGIFDFVDGLSKVAGLQQVRLTTNGVLLEKNCERLYQVGVRHINVSLDTLNREKFKKITGRDLFQQVFSGITKAIENGFKIKINVVALKGINDDEFVSFAKLAVKNRLQVRFIEFMPMGVGTSWKKDHFISSEDIREIISPAGSLEPKKTFHGNGPARLFELKDNYNHESGIVGFISPISHHFCDLCNRLRLTSEGKLRACLLQDVETDMRSLLRSGATDEELLEAIRQTIINKPEGHTLSKSGSGGELPPCSGQMSRIGG